MLGGATVSRPRFLFAGAGATVQLPPSAADTADGGESRDAYFVAPAAHIGRVVTGVVFVAERSGLANAATSGAAARFGLTTVSFADKLAEQGYKVLVLDLFPGAFPVRATPDSPAVARLAERAAAQDATLAAAVQFLKHQHDVQRVGIVGVGAGADFAIKTAMERAVPVDCAVALSPHGVLPWTARAGAKADEESKDGSEAPVVPLLLLIGERTAYATSDAVCCHGSHTDSEGI